jgi:hypothetical protein
MDLKEALEKVQGDQELARRFVEDPTGVLEGLGVGSEEFFIEDVTPEPAGPMAWDACLKVCTKVGVPFVGCKTVGSKQGLDF